MYQFLLIDRLPNSSLVLMSFVRNSNLVFIFWILTFLSVLNSIALRKVSALLLVFVVVIFSRFELSSLIFLNFLIFVVLCFDKFSFSYRTYNSNKIFNNSIISLNIGIFCLFSLYNLYQADKKIKNNFSEFGYEYFRKWTARKENADFFKSLIKIRNDSSSYLFIDLTKEGTKKISSIHGKTKSSTSTDLMDFCQVLIQIH